MRLMRDCLCVLACWIAVSCLAIAADNSVFVELGNTYQKEIQTLIKRDCHKCHSATVMEAEIDLSVFKSITDIRKHPDVWQKVAEMLDSQQMPPKEEPQPTEAERTKLQQWVRNYLKAEASSHAGDPGAVVLRRLNNVEYTNTVRDLTGVASLQPAREFPVDSAAGEGFTNLGNALVVSPALITKYLDAGKEIASHAVLLPNGFRFSSTVTPRDWTEEILTDIRKLYGKYTDERGGTQVNLQGIIFDTNGGGRLPLDRYIEATLVERANLMSGTKTVEAVASERNLSPKYLGLLWKALTSNEPTFLFDSLRARWKAATPADTAAITSEIALWQPALWRFTSIGHIGKLNGPKGWMEPVSPMANRTEIRQKLTANSSDEITIYLSATDAGDGNDHDFAVWENPRLVASGRADLPLRNVRDLIDQLRERREKTVESTVRCLQASDEANASGGTKGIDDLAKRYEVDPEILGAWFQYLNVATGGTVTINQLFTRKMDRAGGYEFVNGWGEDATPLFLANSSDQHVRIPGNMKGHGVVVHPSPTLQAAVGWRSPVTSSFRVEAKIQHAHPECGNGVTWSLELRRGSNRQQLASGVAHGANAVAAKPIEKLEIHKGDLVSLLIGPRDGNHSCDLTAIDLVLTSANDAKTWDLAADVSPNIQAANPHADRFGNDGVWSFYTEPVNSAEIGPTFPAESRLAVWKSAANPEEKQKLAFAVQQLLSGEPPAEKDSADAQLYRQLTSLGGPLFRSARPLPGTGKSKPVTLPKSDANWGLDPALFGRHPDGRAVDGNSLCVKAPAIIEIKLPADLVNGWELVTSGTLHAETGAEGTVQMQALLTKPTIASGIVPSSVTETNANSRWTDNNKLLSYTSPVLISKGSAASKKVEQAFDAYRNLFPAALCYSRIVPVDEVVTLTLYYREDRLLRELMLSDTEIKTLDRLWNELHFVSRDALTQVDGFVQLMEFATQDADPKVFEPLRKPIYDRAAAFKNELLEAESHHVDQLVTFAGRAFRRPLRNEEADDLRGLYQKLRDKDLPHDEAIRFAIARVLVAPTFLYRVEPLSTESAGARPGKTTESVTKVPVSDWALASRLSYFLWSTMPDQALNELAATDRLHEPESLVNQSRRMLKDARIRSLATEFACQWLHIRDFDSHSEKSDQVFPTFSALRGDMYEESIRFFEDLFQRDGSILEVLDADHTFLNESLAKHYGIPGVEGSEWRRVDKVKQYGRGGILTLATTLATQSGASRTSPILRGNWVLETLLGEKLPRPPKNVPPLPESEADADLTVRQLVESHRSIESCAKCHVRIDAFGFSLENYDAIGRRRDKDLGGRPIEVNVELMDGTKFTGEPGLRNYLLVDRRNSFVRHFCRKLLGYALARGVQLSDEPLLDEMMVNLKSSDYRFSSLIETIVRSSQFRYQRTGVEQ